MALQVWLPLTKDLRNQGLATITSSGTPVFKNTGKLGGKSLDLNTRVSFNCSALANLENFSIAFWAKVNSDTTQSTNWVDVIGFTDVNRSSGSTGQLRWETCYASGYESRGISSHNNANDSIGTGFGAMIGANKNTWYHIALVVDYTNGTIKQYCDGIVVSTPTPTGGHLNGAFWLGESGKINGEIQDVRIYDNCLTPEEVKRLAQGLVLHYPLSDSINEAVSNIGTALTNAFEGNSGKYGFNTTDTNIYKTSGTFQGRDCDKVYLNVNNVSLYPYVSFNFSPPANGVRTLSFDYFPTLQSSIVFYTWNTNAKGNVYWKSNNLTGTATNVSEVTIPVQLNCWNHISITVTNIGTESSGWSWMRIGTSSHTSSTSNYWLFDNIMVTTLDHEVPYTPTFRTANTMVYDCSGFCNNGTRVGTLGWSSNTPKYSCSLDITTDSCARYIKHPHLDCLDNAVTMACWIYSTSINGTSNGSSTPNLFIMGQDRDYDIYGFGFRLCSGVPHLYITTTTTGNKDINSNVASCLNSWHHIVGTYDGANAKIYVDGELKTTQAMTGAINWSSTPYDFLIGKMSYGYTSSTTFFPYIGYISDARVYATALSADDVKSLYQNEAYIDSSGNIYGKIR